MGVRVRRFGRKTQADGRELRLGVLEPETGGKTAEHVDLRSLARLKLTEIQVEWSPCIMRNRKPESLWHDADHRRRDASQAYALTDNGRIARKARLPDVVAENHDERGAGLFIRINKRPADESFYTRHLETRRTDLRDPDRFGSSVGRHQVAIDGPKRAEVLD